MKIILGPVLSLRSTSDDIWDISALIVIEGAPEAFTVNAAGNNNLTGTLLLSRKNKDIYRFDMKIKLSVVSQEIEYGFSALKWQFAVPAKTSDPQIAFVSCNGFSSAKEIKKVDDKNALWKQLLSNHEDTAYNLMIMGGDQVYADEIWQKCTLVKKWVELPRSDRRKRTFTKPMQEQVDQFYFDLYCERWKQAPVDTALASIPTAMMWDDHDIFDGWGSYCDEDQNCPVYQGIFAAARKYFAIFQQQLAHNSDETHPSSLGTDAYSFCLTPGNHLVLALDARTERSQKQIISKNSWEKIWASLSEKASQSNKSYKHLFVIATVPVVHADFGKIETLMNWLPGEQELEDDLRDHWQSGPHRAERLRLIHKMLGFMNKYNCRVTILSGDVHVACVGMIECERGGMGTGPKNIIFQLTSSGIVHPSPPKLMGFMLDQLSNEPETVTQGITASMIEFPAHRKKYILARNFLSLEPDNENRIWANWNVEGHDEVLTKVIPPM